MKRLVLASASPRRMGLLKQIGLDFEVFPSSVPETWEENTSPLEIAQKLAREKAEAIAGGFPSGIVIGADTLVVLEGRILGKPQNPDEAFRFLRKLSGRSHDVITAVVLLDAESGRVLADEEVTRVFFREVSDQEIHAYIASGEPMDKAGAYGIQGRGALFVKKIEGCYTNVVGLPLGKLGEMLTRMLHE